MKNSFSFLLLLLLLVVAAGTTSSCNRKTGCPAYQEVHAKTGKDGKLTTKKGSSNLFPKKMRKQMKK